MEGIEKYLAEMQKEVEEKEIQEENPESTPKEPQEEITEEESQEVETPEQEELEEEEEEESIDKDLLKKESAWRRMRKQTKEAKDQAKRVKEELEELRRTVDGLRSNSNNIQPEQKEVEEDAEPDKDFDRESWLDWKVKQQDKILSKVQESVKTNNEATYKQALKAGVEKLENDYKKNDAEYDSVLAFIRERERAAIKLRYPQAKDAQIEQHLEEQKIAFFNDIYNNSGGKRNPAEALKAMAVNVYGYTGKKEQPKDNKRVDMDALKRNQKKSLSLIGGSSSKEGKDKSVDAVFNMTLAEMMSKGDNFLTNMAIQAENEF